VLATSLCLHTLIPDGHGQAATRANERRRIPGPLPKVGYPAFIAVWDAGEMIIRAASIYLVATMTRNQIAELDAHN
jgi:hypothetical protein